MRQRRRHALHETTPTACDLFVIETHRIALFIWGWYKFLESMIIFQYGHYIRSNFFHFGILSSSGFNGYFAVLPSRAILENEEAKIFRVFPRGNTRLKLRDTFSSSIAPGEILD